MTLNSAGTICQNEANAQGRCRHVHHRARNYAGHRQQAAARTACQRIGGDEGHAHAVQAERGRYGCYSLMPGFKLPPMMFSNAEAVAL